MQTMSSGNSHTAGLSMFFSPGKWMAISAVNLAWLRDLHDLHGISTNPGLNASAQKIPHSSDHGL
jgi:hypothetical protein